MMQNVKNLTSSVLLQAAKDYCDRGTSQSMKKVILKDLNSPWMDFLTDGMAKVVAEELLKNEKMIRIRLKKAEELN